MRKTYRTTVILIVAAAMLLTVSRCLAADKSGKELGSDRAACKYKRMALTEEKIEWLMNRLAEVDPDEKERLAKLRDEDPEKFKAELRKACYYKKGFGDRPWQKESAWMRRPPWAGKPGTHPRGFAQKHRREKLRGMERAGRRMKRKHAEYVKWLEENYPEKAEELAQIRDKKPQLYHRRAALGWKRYHEIMEAEEENPEVAAVLKEDLKLKAERDKLLRKVKRTVDQAKKQELKRQLEEVVAERFGLIVQRKQLRYEKLLEKLEKLREEVKQREAEVEKLKSKKKERIKERLEELLSKAEKISWD